MLGSIACLIISRLAVQDVRTSVDSEAYPSALAYALTYSSAIPSALTPASARQAPPQTNFLDEFQRPHPLPRPVAPAAASLAATTAACPDWTHLLLSAIPSGCCPAAAFNVMRLRIKQ
ncbi:hypothetical protein VaNZ11_016697 [Volvox africanus]|uniref:Uncharacterized protein n=1 Tax=Volvox africanus TaxID=51714 RepID=A0ABQ5SNG9_9CHLO|nr:hypothetical protein VaNZ11_016697 [Volvox africanus]